MQNYNRKTNLIPYDQTNHFTHKLEQLRVEQIFSDGEIGEMDNSNISTARFNIIRYHTLGSAHIEKIKLG